MTYPQYVRNNRGRRLEAQWPSPRVFKAAGDFLELNRHRERYFLWVDSFDPHEPWDPMPAWDTYTDPAYQGPRLILPMGGPADAWATPEQARYIRGLYAGEAGFVDHCLGRLFRALKELGYYDDSVIVLTADHGHPLADHGKFLKGGDRMYNELLRVPYMIRLPGGEGARRSQALVQFPDTLPTVLDLMGMGSDTGAMHGHSFLPVLRGDTDAHRETIIAGYYAAPDRCVRDQRWSYVSRPEGQPDELYDLVADPYERANLIDEHPDQARRLARAYGGYFRRGGTQVEVKGIQGKYEMASGSVA